MEPKYKSGETIRNGDQIKYAGENGIVEFIITDASTDWDYYWNELRTGVMFKIPSFGSVYVPFDDVELEFVSRIPHI